MAINAITVVIRHETDQTANQVVDQLHQFMKQGLLRQFLDVVVSNGTTTVESDLGCRLFTEDGITDDTLLNSIARVGDFEILRLGLINASEDSESISIDLKNVVIGIHNWLNQLLGSNVNVVDIRIGLRAFGEALPHQDFFPITSNANILVIPQDRITDGGVARPIARTEEVGGGHSLVLHGAVEVSSLLGLWQSMGMAPIDNYRPMLAGSATPRIMFAQSRVRAMLGPGLPMDRVAPIDEELPAPRDHFSVADSSFAAESIAELVYPNYLRFFSEPEPDFFTYKSGLRQLIAEFFKEVGRTIVGIPKVVARGIQDELGAIAGEGLQNAIGSDSWVQILWSGRDGDNAVTSLTQNQIDQVLQAVEFQYRRELLSPLDSASWALIVKSVLSAIDGSSDFAKERQELFGNEKLLLLKRHSISDVEEDLTEVLMSLSHSIRIVENQPPIASDALIESDDSSDWEDPVPSDLESAGDETQDELVGATVVPDLVVMSDDQSIGITVSPVINEGLLAKITSRFQEEAQAAHNHVLSMAERIRGLYSQLEVRDTSSVSPIFNAALAFAFAVLIFVVGTCTRLRTSVSFESASLAVQDSLWISFSSIFIIGSILLLGVGGKRTWQVRALLTSVLVSVYVGVLVVFFNDLRKQFSNLADNVWPAVILGVGTLGLVAIAVVRSVTNVSQLRRRLGRVFGFSACVYLLLGLTIWQARTDSFIGQQTSGLRGRLFWVSTITSLLLIVSCFVFVSVIVIRERNRLNSIAKSIEWARKEIISSADAEKRLSAAAIQWITTAAVLNRVVNLPLGKLFSSGIELRDDIAKDDAILKFDAARLSLTDIGLTTFVASLRNNFVEKGWLSRQYEKLVREYQLQLAARTGNAIESVENRRPEGDPEVLLLEDLLGGKSRSERFRFLASVYNGEFDESLIRLPDNFDLKEVYQPILEDRSAYDLNGAQFDGLSIVEFMRQICPTNQPKLPVGLVRRTFTANDAEQEMKAFLWWPTEIVGDIEFIPTSVERHQTTVRRDGPITSTIAVMAVRVDLSELFLYSECQNQPEIESVQLVRMSDEELGQTDL